MKIYTTYFARVPKLPDGIVPIAVCLFPPSGWNKPHCIQLAPQYSVFKRYKGNSDFAEFTRSYVETTLSRLSIDYILDYFQRYGDGKDIAIVCYEKSPFMCHRSIIAEWLKYNNIEVSEWNP